MPIVGTASASSTARATVGRDGLEHDREAARRPASASASSTSCCAAVGRAALHLEAAEHGRGLRREADVAHHRDARVDDRPRARDRRAAALELHRVGAALLHEPHRVRDRLLVRGLVGAERHVGDDERPLRAARHPLRHEHDLVERDRHGRLAAVHDHARRVADEDQVDAGLVGEPAARRVVGGDHDDLLAAALHLGELRQRQLAGRPGRVARGLGAHVSSPSRMTLSIRRVAPTRTAAARTVASSRSTIST